jgi:nicotinamide-nucleotide amidase
VRRVVGAAIYGEDGADLAEVVLSMCRIRGLTVGVAESCTGGLLGGRLTAIPGSSDVVRGGIIAYDDGIKTSLLGVSGETLREHGAVSEPTARAMASGARRAVGTGVALAITGVAGPGGGSEAKPVGTVWIALDVEGQIESRRYVMVGDRAEVRHRSAQAAMEMLRRRLLA